MTSSPKHQAMVRQELPEVLFENRAVYVTRREVLLKGGLYGRKVAPLRMTEEESMDIDNPADLALAEFILRQKRNSGG